jgi:glycosyltransferase involved in cell wall biosynthesis
MSSFGAASEARPAEVWVVIPAYNEADVIRPTVEGVLALGVNVIVVDDSSADRTGEKLAGLPVTVLRHLVNLGQGAAIQTGFDAALARGARVLVTFDADGQHDPADIPKLVSALFDQQADVALGSRFLGSAPGLTRSRKFLLKAALLLTRATSGLALTDVHNGLRAFRADVLRGFRISQNRMAHASEILHDISNRHLRHVEVPVSVRYTARSRIKGQTALGTIDIVYDLVIGRFRK